MHTMQKRKVMPDQHPPGDLGRQAYREREEPLMMTSCRGCGLLTCKCGPSQSRNHRTVGDVCTAHLAAAMWRRHSAPAMQQLLQALPSFVKVHESVQDAGESQDLVLQTKARTGQMVVRLASVSWPSRRPVETLYRSIGCSATPSKSSLMYLRYQQIMLVIAQE